MSIYDLRQIPIISLTNALSATSLLLVATGIGIVQTLSVSRALATKGMILIMCGALFVVTG